MSRFNKNPLMQGATSLFCVLGTLMFSTPISSQPPLSPARSLGRPALKRVVPPSGSVLSGGSAQVSIEGKE